MKTAISLLLLLTAAAYAADWPQWRGPQRDGISSETDLLQSWSADGPTVQWRTPLGNGFSGISIANGRVFTMFAQGDDEFAICLDAETGAERWRHRTGPYYKETPRRRRPALDTHRGWRDRLCTRCLRQALRTRSREWHADLGKGLGRRI